MLSAPPTEEEQLALSSTAEDNLVSQLFVLI